MRIKNISRILVLYIALIEGISLLIQAVSVNLITVATEPLRAALFGLTTGFFGMLFTILIYNSLPFKININNKKIDEVRPLVPSVFNALFLAISFLIQISIERIENLGITGYALMGFISIGIAALLSLYVYNEFDLKINYVFDKKNSIIKKIPLSIALLAGFFEAFILPPMFIFYNSGMDVFLTGFLAGLFSIIPLLIVNLVLKKLKLII